MTKRPKITKEAARKRGLKIYFAGPPCRRSGHDDGRYVSNGRCIACARLAGAARAKRLAGDPKFIKQRRRAQARHQFTPKGRATQRRYWASPKGREATWRTNHSPKGHERVWRYLRTPKAHERQHRSNRSEAGREAQRRYQLSDHGRTQTAARRHELQWEKAEAAYKASPTQANYDRYMRLIARRTKDGRP
jgi:hypothetical protein